MSLNTRKHKILASAVALRRQLMPENSLINKAYCRYVQPAIRCGVDLIYLLSFEKTLDAPTTADFIASERSWPDADAIRSVLIIKLDHIGDFVLGFPAYQALRNAFPHAKVTLLCGGWNKFLAEESGLFDRVECLNVFNEASGLCNGGIDFDRDAFAKLGLADFDLAIDFRDNGETRFLLDLVGAKFRAGFAAIGANQHMDLAFPSAGFALKPNQGAHHQTLQSLLSAAVIAAVNDARSMSSVLKKIGADLRDGMSPLGQGPTVGINVGSGDVAKNWPLRRFIELGRRLIEDLDATIVLLGSSRQAEDSQKMVDALASSRVINRVGEISLPQCMAVMRKLDLYIGNDTGTTHIAAGLGVPTLCLFSGLTTHASHGAIGSKCVSLLADRKRGIATLQTHRVLEQAADMLGKGALIKQPFDGLLNFIVIDNKPYNSDFRKYLLREASEAGANAMHIDCSKGVVITVRGKVLECYEDETGSAVIAADIKHLLGQKKTIILAGLGLCARRLGLIRHLKASFSDSIALYDVFDYYRYEATGYRFFVQAVLDMAMRWVCNKSVILDKGLWALYPFAAHLDNASHVVNSASLAPRRHDRLVYIGSIDCRVDFTWLEALMNLGVGLDIYGRVHKDDEKIARELAGFLDRNKNAVFVGGYDNDQLSSILSQYKIGVVPYRVNFTMTKHINPDKVYHYLNAGLEVISTPIPQCSRMNKYLHLSKNIKDISSALASARTNPRVPSWPAAQYTWKQRWVELMAIAGIKAMKG
ncbi:MAG: hypothetical protein KGI37_08865 [Alphaproteobacteria bacterium]|nr:hypothetical protein [Alphaproteobacteria bacterium]